MTSWADDVPEPTPPRSGGRRGSGASSAEPPRRSVLDRLGPAASPASSSGTPLPAPRAHAVPAPRPAGREARGRGGDGPDFGTEVDWRLSRVSLDDDRGPRQGARGARGSPADAAPRRVVTVTPPSLPKPGVAEAVAIPSRLAGRLVLPGAVPQVASPPSRRTPPPAPRDAAAAAPPAKGGAAPFVVRVSPHGERVVERAVAASPPAASAAPPAKVAAPKPAAKAGALPAPRAPGWLFRDPRGTVQGPHGAGELVAWYVAGYYGADLPCKRAGAEAWTTLSAAMPELRADAEAAAPKAGAAPQAAAKGSLPAPVARPAPKGEPKAQGEQAAPAADAAAEAPAASVWSTAETAAAKRLFDKLGTLWTYIDPTGERQGPFGGHDMATWFLGGYMEDRELKVANATAPPHEPADADFAPLAALLKQAGP